MELNLDVAKARELLDVSPRSQEENSPQSGSMAQRLAACRLDSARRRRLNSHTRAPLRPSNSGNLPVVGKTNRHETPPPTVYASSQAVLHKTPLAPSKKKELATTPAGLRSLASRYDDRAKRMEAPARKPSSMSPSHVKEHEEPSLCVRIGESLHLHKTDIKSLTSEWSALRRAEFRLLVRKMLPQHTDLQTVDGLFKTVCHAALPPYAAVGTAKEDTGVAAHVDVRHVRTFLRAQQDVAAKAAIAQEKRHALALHYRRRAEQLEMAAVAAEHVEAAEARLFELREAPSLTARVGALVTRERDYLLELLGGNSTGESVIVSNEGSAHGEQKQPNHLGGEGHVACVDTKALYGGLRRLGLVAGTAELNAIFAKCATAADLWRTLKALQAAAASAEADSLQQAKTCAMLSKAFHMQHAALVKGLAEDALELATLGDTEENLARGGRITTAGPGLAMIRALAPAAAAPPLPDATRER